MHVHLHACMHVRTHTHTQTHMHTHAHMRTHYQTRKVKKQMLKCRNLQTNPLTPGFLWLKKRACTVPTFEPDLLTACVHGCHMIATWVIQSCHMDVTGLSHGCHMIVTWVIQSCHMDVTGLSHGCHMGITTWVLTKAYSRLTKAGQGG